MQGLFARRIGSRESDRDRNGRDVACDGSVSAARGASRARFRFIGIRLLVENRSGRNESREGGHGSDDGSDQDEGLKSDCADDPFEGVGVCLGDFPIEALDFELEAVLDAVDFLIEATLCGFEVGLQFADLELEAVLDAVDFLVELMSGSLDFLIELMTGGLDIGFGRGLSVNQFGERRDLLDGEAGGLEFENCCSAHGVNPIMERETGEVEGVAPAHGVFVASGARMSGLSLSPADMGRSRFLALLDEDGELMEPSIEVALRATAIDNYELAGHFVDRHGNFGGRASGGFP